MKKLFTIVIIGILFIGLPMTTAISSPFTQLLKPIKGNINNNITTYENAKTNSIKNPPPIWAKGNYSGIWGLDIWGEYNIPLGWMIGYYKLSVNIGYFAAGFNFFGELNIKWFIQGYFFGMFMFGNMDKNEYTNQTFFAGISKYNETEYHWRVIGEEGPTFFMHGTYTRFN